MEFYRQAKRHLNPDGLFVQWMHLYEIDIQLLASVMKALKTEFNSYTAYFTTDADILFIASMNASIGEPSDVIFNDPELQRELQRIKINSLADIGLRKLGSHTMLSPLFDSYATPANSDYYPWLDLGAAKTRFMNLNAYELSTLLTAPFPLHDVLDERERKAAAIQDKGIEFAPGKAAQEANLIDSYYRHGKLPEGMDPNEMLYALSDLRAIQTIQNQCNSQELDAVWLPTLHLFIDRTLPYLDRASMQRIFNHIESAPCYSALSAETVRMIEFYKALAQRDFHTIISIAETLIPAGKIPTSDKMDFVVKACALAYIALDKQAESAELLNRYLEHVKRPDIVHKLLKAHAEQAIVTED